MPWRGALMVCGTSSSAGKSTVVAGLCRLLARRGVDVAPFKAQNMSNNAAVCTDGAEIGRAQYAQALAAGVEPTADMNPVLLKPLDDRRAQVVALGRPAGTVGAADYGDGHAARLELVLDALGRLRRAHDVVVIEGAGSPAELNLLERDVANLPLACAARVPAIVVADVDRGGMLAAAYGTVALLPAHLRACVRGFLVNRFRGDVGLLQPGLRTLEERTGLPVLGVLPHVDGAVDAEDSLDVPGRAGGADRTDAIRVAAIATPCLSNFTDLEPIMAEPEVSVRFVQTPEGLHGADLIVLAGSRAVVDDLAWMRTRGFVDALSRTDAVVLGICGGYQMLGDSIRDPDGVESATDVVDGLGLLPVTTTFDATKTTRIRRGEAFGAPVTGYEIRHGRPRRRDGDGWVHLDDEHGREHEGAYVDDRVFGTSVHGLFESDELRSAFLTWVACRRGREFRPASIGFADARRGFHDALADAIEAHADVDRLLVIIASADAGVLA